MREVLSKRELTENLYNLDSNYYINIDDAVRSIIAARTIIRKYMRSNDIKDKLLLNNIIIANNILGVKLTNYAIYNTFDDNEFPYAKSVLLFLNIYDSKFGFENDLDKPLLDLFNDTLTRYKNISNP